MKIPVSEIQPVLIVTADQKLSDDQVDAINDYLTSEEMFDELYEVFSKYLDAETSPITGNFNINRFVVRYKEPA